MATCKYSLRGDSIQLRFSYGRGKLLQIATGWKVKKAQHWNHNTQSIRSVLEHPEYKLYNSKLRDLSKFMLDEYDKLMIQEVVVTNDDLKLSFTTSYISLADSTLCIMTFVCINSILEGPSTK